MPEIKRYVIGRSARDDAGVPRRARVALYRACCGVPRHRRGVARESRIARAELV